MTNALLPEHVFNWWLWCREYQGERHVEPIQLPLGNVKDVDDMIEDRDGLMTSAPIWKMRIAPNYTHIYLNYRGRERRLEHLVEINSLCCGIVVFSARFD